MIKKSLIVIWGMIIMLNVQAAEYKQPEFTLQLSTTGVGVDVRLNDISIEFEMYSGHSTMTYDVNESVVTGVNELKIIAFPFFEENDSGVFQTKLFHAEAEVKATLFVNEKGESNNKQILTQINFRPNFPLGKASAKESLVIDGLEDVMLDDNSQLISFPGFTFNKQIVATRNTLPIQGNYNRWAWQDGKKIDDTQENYDSLLAFYKKIHEAYKTNNRKKLFEFYEPAAKEFSEAYYLRGGIAEGQAFIETGELLDNGDAELNDFYTEGVKLDIFANGKMARIVDIGLYHPVVFVHKTKDLIYTLKFGFYKNQQNKWVMIR